ncbi:MAG TPA: alpha/beta hydrolase fold domain-containing protein [Actinoplanes sp.]|nr:alpha/beta hydrolase fold domain-containing protein [Actinoplanes sp.]
MPPEHAYPAQLEDAVTAYRWVVEQGLTTALAGDSSGGGLCVTAALRIAELGLPAPAALLLISPWVDMELTGTSYESNAGTDLIFTRSMVQGLADLYLTCRRSSGPCCCSARCSPSRRPRSPTCCRRACPR